MTKDDIIRMAREAGFTEWCPGWHAWTDELERFAAIVAEKYKQKIQDLEDMVIELQERKE